MSEAKELIEVLVSELKDECRETQRYMTETYNLRIEVGQLKEKIKQLEDINKSLLAPKEGTNEVPV